MNKYMDKEYELILLKEEHIKTLYDWNIKEQHFECYTCRPLKSVQTFESYYNNTLNMVSERKAMIYVIVDRENSHTPLGKITLFDFNPRNHSAEFGYYLPQNSRAHGLGSIMLTKFIEKCFNDNELDLNKIYATTSSNNLPSIRLLQKFRFKLDGRLREHYWIGEDKYDQLVYSMLKSEYNLLTHNH